MLRAEITRLKKQMIEVNSQPSKCLICHGMTNIPPTSLSKPTTPQHTRGEDVDMDQDDQAKTEKKPDVSMDVDASTEAVHSSRKMSEH